MCVFSYRLIRFRLHSYVKQDTASVEDCRDGELTKRSAVREKRGDEHEEDSGSDWSAGAKQQVICSRLQIDGALSLQKTIRAQLMPFFS